VAENTGHEITWLKHLKEELAEEEICKYGNPFCEKYRLMLKLSSCRQFERRSY
jgi:hypothetical protein